MMLVNMLPRPAGNDMPDSASANTKVGSKVIDGMSPRGVLLPDFSNRTGRQHGIAICLAVAMARLCDTVLAIICNGSKEQVIWTNAPAVVTGVAHKEAVWNWPVRQFPCNAMGSIMRSPRCFIGYHAITARAYGASPFPASRICRLIYLAPETLFKWNVFRLIGTTARAESSPASFYSPRRHRERIATNLAGTLDGHSGFLSRTWGATPTAVSAARRLFDVSILPSTSRNMIEKGV